MNTLKKMAGRMLAGVLVTLAVTTGFAAADTLEDVQDQGFLDCGVNTSLPGFSHPDENNEWTGLDVDLCRAVAAAVLGDSRKVKFIPLSAKERFTALQTGEIDILSRNTTWTFTRDNNLGLDFVGVVYYDGQGFMVRKDLGVTSARDLAGATVCVNAGTTTELNVADYFRTNQMDYSIVTFENGDETVAAYDAGRCDVFSSDQSQLAAQRSKLQDPGAHMILPEVISKEPLGPAVRQGDDQWGDIVRWSLYAMIAAEEYGLSTVNVKLMRDQTNNPEIRRLLGTEGNLGGQLGLAPDWAYQIISQVGNYGEAFSRNVGMLSPLGLARNLNRLWTQGGLLYVPPFR